MNYCNCPNCQTANCPAATADEAQAQALVRSSELVLRLREQLAALASRAAYVCAHDYEAHKPVGTRLIAISDLKTEYNRTVTVMQETQNDQAQARDLSRPTT